MKRSDIPDELVLRHAAEWFDGPRPTSTLGVVGRLICEGVPSHLAESKVEHLVSRGLLECGVSPWFAWPTEAGRALLSNAPRGKDE